MTEEVVHIVRRTCRKGVTILARKVVDTVVGAESLLGSAVEVAESAAESVAEAAAEVVSGSVADAAADSVTEAAAETLTENLAEMASESVVEATAGAFEEAIAETAAEPVSETVIETVTEAASDAAESILEAASETVAAGVQVPLTVLNMMGVETMNYRQVYQMMAGKSLADDDYLEPYVASVLFLVIVIAMGYLLRKMTKTILPGSLQVFVVEFIATMEACSYFFENNNILKHYGYGGFFVAIVLEILISNRTFEGASENPIKALDEFSRREVSFDIALVKITVQSLGGLASYRLAQLVWSLDMVPDHRERFFETSCQTDLAVTIFLGFLVEMGAALIDTWVGKQSLSKNSFVDELIKAVSGGAMIVAGVSLTGMYFNPAMATGHMLGCKGTDIWEHILVYWIGPFVGCLIAILLDKLVKIENGKLV